MEKRRYDLNKTRQDAKDMIKIIERLPEEKKREVLGIIRGYALCAETEKDKEVT